MLEIVKTALRITSNAFDAELALLINACINELQGMGVLVHNPGAGYYVQDEEAGSGFVYTIGDDIYAVEQPATEAEYPQQIQMAVIAYCKWLFGNNPDKDQWREIYHTMLAQLKTMTGFTQWRPSNG